MIGKINHKVDAEVVFFLHIPKTAGSTLNSIIENQYKKFEIYNCYGWKREDALKLIERFKTLPNKDKDKIKLVRGHVETVFGLHEHINRSYTYITILRHPVERVISHYYYVMRTPKHHLYEFMKNSEMTLQEFVSSDVTSEIDNDQTRRISGNILSKEKSSVQMLDEAKIRLQQFYSVVGITERFEETLLLIKKSIGWNRIYYQNTNVSNKKPKIDKITKEIINCIEEKNRFDTELYRYVKRQFDADINEMGAAVSAGIRTIKLQNTFFGGINRIKNSFAKL